MPDALIVEHDHDCTDVLAELTKAAGLSTMIASSLVDARQQMLLRAPDVVLLDLVVPDGDRTDRFSEIDELAGGDIVLTTGHASLKSSNQVPHLDAADHIVKPIGADSLARAAPEIGHVVAVEVRWTEGGLGDAVVAPIRGGAELRRHKDVRRAAQGVRLFRSSRRRYERIN